LARLASQNKSKKTYPKPLWAALWISLFTSHGTRTSLGFDWLALFLSSAWMVKFSVQKLCYGCNLATLPVP
jgi:hypothetical protein